MEPETEEAREAPDAPDVGDRLTEFERGRDRCLRAAKNLSLWSYFWNVMLIGVGALVAAQGAFVKIAGNAAWVTVLFIILGVLTAAGSGYNAFFKPGARSPKFATLAFQYDRAARDLERQVRALTHPSDALSTQPATDPEAARSALSTQADDRLDALRLQEIALYATGPTRMAPASVRERRVAR